VLAALALFAIMVLTLVDVSGRKLLNGVGAGLAGADRAADGGGDLRRPAAGVAAWRARGVRLARPAAAALAAPRCSRRWSTWFLPAALGALAWLMWTKAGQMAEYGDTTAQLKLPLGPFVYLMSVLCG
jgi:hypothetical protein